jgi:uncharacterized protein YutD
MSNKVSFSEKTLIESQFSNLLQKVEDISQNWKFSQINLSALNQPSHTLRGLF